ncbi:glycosyltransferase family 4 protein [Halorubrum sp. GN12_10-3_MGM]|uniref:glycosyltransferase family 4 protein n=1 Tax=Halorubrum sp. GN12_10-3_MGM TaxID=2518113 RepID=UPI0010F6DF98|nr:glycosyltransferase family 4 protein [Halorubrum sp. GN12_10-3_MGM]TKX63179.1 glycosyltransferase family 1 protein [Halorubrum sp. GN12_10-3_MGM]
MSDENLPDVCVVTHPLAAAGENATRSLLDILAAITSVALVTADLPADSEIRDRREVVELTRKGTGASVSVAAARFALNQLRMCRVLADRDESVVLFYGATSYLLPIVAARLLGKTVLVEPRGDVPLTLRLNWEPRMPGALARLLSDLVRALERAGFAVADGVVTYTPEMARQLSLHPEAPNVYPSGARYVRTEEFSVTRPYEERDRVVGFLGRLDEEKGIRELAAVARELPDDVMFRFIGDGDLREWLETELEAERAEGTVELTGWVDHNAVPAQLNDLALLVMPSQPTEGLPTTILEALACGTPVLASPVSGVPDVVRDGETGYHIDSREPAQLQAQITWILNEEPLADISASGRSLIDSEYSFEAATERYLAILASFAN